MKDILYIVKNTVLSFGIVTCSFVIDLSSYYKIDYVSSVRRLFTSDIYTLTYYATLILFIIVLFELWKTLMDTYEQKYRYYIIWGCFVMIQLSQLFLIPTLFKTMMAIFLWSVIVRILYHIYKEKKK